MVSRSRKITGADGIRALACLWVFGNHASIALEKPWGGDGFFRVYGTLGVAVFFVLSGMLLSVPFWQRYEDGRPFPALGPYTRARLARILPAYYFCLVVMLLFDGDFSRANLTRFFTAVFLVNSLSWRTFFPTEIDGALWSIGVEIVFYLLLPLWAIGLFRLRRRVPAWLYLLLSAGALVGFQALVVRVRASFEDAITSDARELQRVAAGWLPVMNPLGLFAHFLFGVAAGALFVHLSRRLEGEGGATGAPRRSAEPAIPSQSGFIRRAAPGWNRFDWASLALVAMLYLDLYPPASLRGLWRHAHLWFMSYNWPIFPGLILGLLVALSFSARLGAWVDNAFLRWTGKLSYGIYLWHIPILRGLTRCLPRLVRGMGLPGQIVYTLLGASLAYLVAALSSRYLEQPVLDWVVGKPKT